MSIAYLTMHCGGGGGVLKEKRMSETDYKYFNSGKFNYAINYLCEYPDIMIKHCVFYKYGE
jgi:hypothetical protein